MTYMVQAGDTLSAIARSAGITLAELVDLNPRYKGRTNSLRIGALLTLPDTDTQNEVEDIPGEMTGSTQDSVSAYPDQVCIESPAEPTIAQPPLPVRALGSLSTRYETGGRGSATVSGGLGDYGGVSYGSYQMTSQPEGGTVSKFIRSDEFPWHDAFDGLFAGTPMFTTRWKALVSENPQAFGEAEHAFINRTHFEALRAKILSASGVDVLERSNALQNVVWSVAVQHGPGTKLVCRAITDLLNDEGQKCSSDRHLINAIYDERSRCSADGALAYFAKNSPAVQEGVRKRFASEREEALRWLNEDPAFGEGL